MSKKQLPLKQPPVYGYQFYSFPLAILTNYEQTKPWVLSNFIQMAFNRDFLDAPVPFCFYLFDYAYNPWLTVNRLSRDVFALTRNDINDFLVDCLKNDYYVYLNVDEFYIPNRPSYESYHFSHDLLVYGYDLETQEFDILGFDEKFLYRSSKVNFTLFKKAYQSLDVIENYCNQFYLYKYNPDAKYGFNLKLVIETLEDYLYGRNTSERFSMLEEPWERAYGMDGYPYLKKYVELCLEGTALYDIRYFHILWEHKSIMTSRVEHMEGVGILEKGANYGEKFRQLAGKALSLRNLFLKYDIVKNDEVINRIFAVLGEIETDERALLQSLTAALRLKITD